MTLDAESEPFLEDIYRPRHDVDWRATVRPLFSGSGDPAFLSTPEGFWRAVRTPDGPATLHVQMGVGAERSSFRIRAWGAGAEWARTSVPDLLGARDDWGGLDLSGSTRLAEVRRRN